MTRKHNFQILFVGWLVAVMLILAAPDGFAQRISDHAGRYIGMVDNDRYYDGSGRFIGRVDGSRLFDSAGRNIGRIDGDRVYDGAGRLSMATIRTQRWAVFIIIPSQVPPFLLRVFSFFQV